MADSSANLKVKATMDNADLKKKCKDSKDALRDFSKVSEDAVDALGDALGVNLNKFGEISNAIQGLGIKLKDSGDKGVAAFGNLLTGVNSLTLGLAGIGIGTVVAGFKLLSSEAENFKNTIAGANMELATAAYIDTYQQVIHDFNRDVGKGVAETESRFKRFFGTIGAGLRAGIQTGALASTGMGEFNTDAFERYANLVDDASTKARTAAEISNEIYTVQRQLSDKAVEWARAERNISEYKRIAYDKTVDTVIQQQALTNAVELINKRYQEEANLRGRLADLQKEYNGLAESSVEDIEKANQLRVKEEEIISRMNNALRELSERQATITENAEKEAAARAAAAAAAEKMAQRRAEADAFAESMAITSSVNTPNEVVQMKPVGIAVRPELDVQSAIDVSEELQQIMTSSFETIGVAIGGLIGDLATGGDAWANFADVAISAFADLATFVGKTAIATGTATLGIKAALESLNGWAAIAAGVALVALGAAVKASLSNAASGSYGYTGGGVASASGSYGSSSSGFGTGFEMREMTVNVTGTLRADGNQLLTVIENENKRKNHTT